MAKYVAKITHHGGQCKLSIPKALADLKGLHKAKYIILDDSPEGGILLRRFLDGESLESHTETDSPGST